MKNTPLFFFTMLFFAFGCSSKPSFTHTHPQKDLIYVDSIKKTISYNNPYLIPENLFLENRVDNCDSAIVFMKHSIIPSNSGLNGFVIRGESKKFLFQEKLVDKYFLVPNNQRFYLSIACLVGQDIQTVLDVFAKPKFHKGLLEKYRTKKKFVLYIKGLDCVSFYLFGRDGVITQAKFNYTQRIH